LRQWTMGFASLDPSYAHEIPDFAIARRRRA
jgi:hypothetical protein